MDRRMLLVVIIVAAAAAIGLIIYFLGFYDFSAKKTVVLVSQTPAAGDQLPRVTNTQTPATSSQPSAADSVDQGAVVQEDAVQVAKTFTERFGTWSNQSGAGQFDDLKFFTTAKMWSWIKDNQNSIVKGADNYQEYYGMTTQAVASRLLNLQTGVAATVLVSAKRTASKGSGEPRVFNQDIKVELKKIGSSWKVDGASWQ